MPKVMSFLASRLILLPGKSAELAGEEGGAGDPKHVPAHLRGCQFQLMTQVQFAGEVGNLRRIIARKSAVLSQKVGGDQDARAGDPKRVVAHLKNLQLELIIVVQVVNEVKITAENKPGGWKM